MAKMSPYDKAHLVVAAVRVLGHNNGVPPTAGDTAAFLGMTAEEAGAVVNALKKSGVLVAVESAAGERLYPGEMAPIEELPKDNQGSGMMEDLKKFEAEKKAQAERFAAMTKKEDQRKKDLFSSLQAQLRDKIKSTDPEK
jgi:hypothetical protein